jgi:hypothetical protein
MISAPQGQKAARRDREQTERGDAMDQGPLVTEQIEAAARFLGEFQKSYPIQAAFWLKDNDKGRWYLYVASDEITDDNFDVAYGEVVRIWAELQDPWFDAMKVKVIGANNRLAKAAAELRRRFPGPRPGRLFNQVFGGVDAAEVYLYPSPIPAPAQ